MNCLLVVLLLFCCQNNGQKNSGCSDCQKKDSGSRSCDCQRNSDPENCSCGRIFDRSRDCEKDCDCDRGCDWNRERIPYPSSVRGAEESPGSCDCDRR